MLRKQSGNMYPFVTHTWNPIKGRCAHDCVYCYMKRFKLNEVRLDEKDLNTDLGENNFIFVGSGTDMWAKNIRASWIYKTLEHVRRYNLNKYLFQTKHPARFVNFHRQRNWIYATTIETNRDEYQLSKAPLVADRANALETLANSGYQTMVTVEPIVDFDLAPLALLIEKCQPAWVNIGADSKGHNLLEPPADKIRELIAELERFTEVKVKPNLKRLLI